MIRRSILAATALSIALAGAISAPSFAQSTNGPFEWDPTAFPVEGGGSMPFFGGIGSISTSAKFRFADIDEDNDPDFYSLGPDGRIALYENVGSPSDPEFVPRKDNVIDPPIEVPWGWFLFVDIDADGTLEMFAGDTPDTNEFGLYENVGTGADPLFQWQPFPAYMDSARDAMAGFGNVPAFEDLDGDGDLDFFHMNPIGLAAVNWNVGTPTAPFFSSQEIGFGNINTYIEQLAKQNAGGTLDVDADERHGASIPAFADLDEDSDLDLILGDQILTNVFYFRNDGTPDSAAYTQVSSSLLEFPVEEPSVQIWTVLADLDGDDIFELIIGPTDNLGAYESSVLLYKDATPIGEPTWAFESDSLIYGIDVGSRSLPAFGDIDDDGDDDLVLGKVTRQDLEGAGKQGLVFFENVGTSTAPAFRRVPPEEDPFSDVIQPDLNSPAPVLADMDGDDDLDVLVAQDGLPRHVLYFENQGTPAAASFRYIGVLLDANIRRRPDNAGAPTVGDLDRDGDLDMLVGEYGNTGRPKIYWYDNTGAFETTAAGKRPVFAWVTSRADSAFGFDTVADSVNGFLVPYLFDSNCDGYLDIWIGARDGRLREYRNRGEGDSLHFDLVTNKFEGIVPGSLSAPAFEDIDGDGDFDIFLGEESGGINFYRNESGGLLSATPTATGVLLEWSVPSSGEGVFDVLRAEDDGPFERVAEVPHSAGSQFSYVDAAGVAAVARYRYQLNIALACGSLGPVEAFVDLSDVEVLGASAIADSNDGVRIAWTVSSGYPGLAFRLSRSDSGGEFALVPGGEAIPGAIQIEFVDSTGSASSRYQLDALYRESGVLTIAPDSIFTPLVIRVVADCALDATPTQEGIEVEWRATPEEAGAYQLSRAENEGAFAMIAEIPASEGPDFMYADSAAGYAGNRYSYKLDPVGTKLACVSYEPVAVDVAFPDSLDITSSVALEAEGALIEWSVANPYRGLAFRLSRSDDGGPFTTVAGAEAIPNAGENAFLDPAGAGGDTYRLEPLFSKNGGYEVVPDSVLAPTLLQVADIVVEFKIFAPYPNPARGPVQFFFDLPAQTSVALAVFEPSGRLVRDIGPMTLPSGSQQSIVWDGRDNDGSVVSNGLYLYRIEAGGQTSTGRLIHLR